MSFEIIKKKELIFSSHKSNDYDAVDFNFIYCIKANS